jgi:hypothetical protein
MGGWSASTEPSRQRHQLELADVNINRRQKVVLLTGGLFLILLWGLTFVLRATTWLDRPAITCKFFPTKSLAFPSNRATVCLTEIVRPWDELSEDGDYQLSIYNPTSRIRTDVSMRVSIPIQRKKLSIFWRVERAQSYNFHGIEIGEESQRYTSNHPKFIPSDITEPVWWWLVGLSRVYTSPRQDYETIIDGVVERTSRVIATLTAAGLTIYRFIAASGEN